VTTIYFLVGNSGFYFVRPTPAAKYLHSQSLVVGMQRRLTNQEALGSVLGDMLKRNKSSILIRTLDSNAFPCGNVYFEKGVVVYVDNVVKCKYCVIVHNNWIVGKDAKIYRFKETGMWQVDSKDAADSSAAGGYYSNPERRYLSYENIQDFGPVETLERETNALKSVLYIGHLLNRTVILPSFHCYGCVFGIRAHYRCAQINRCFDETNPSCTHNMDIDNTNNRCTLNTFYQITRFHSTFGDSYREHVFLQHPKVPDLVKQHQSPPMFIKSPSTILSNLANQLANENFFTPSDSMIGASRSEILAWFMGYKDVPVLRFHSLYNAISDERFLGVMDNTDDNRLMKKIRIGFRSSTYRQYN